MTTPKLTTAICKEEIVKYVKRNPGQVFNQFEDEKLSLTEFELPATLVKNWKRTDKSKDGNKVIRAFNCEPYDDQLRAYVYSNSNDTVILDVEVVGE